MFSNILELKKTFACVKNAYRQRVKSSVRVSCPLNSEM